MAPTPRRQRDGAGITAPRAPRANRARVTALVRALEQLRADRHAGEVGTEAPRVGGGRGRLLARIDAGRVRVLVDQPREVGRRVGGDHRLVVADALVEE